MEISLGHKHLLFSKIQGLERFIVLAMNGVTESNNKFKYSLVPIWKMASTMLYYSKSVLKVAFKDTKLDIGSFSSKHFDTERVSDKGYTLNGFRTDGYQIQLSYVASKILKPRPKNTDNLQKAGYQIPTKTFKIPDETKGVFVLHQSRMDNSKVKQSDIPFIRVTCVDPGCSEVVSVRTCDLDKCNDPGSIVENSSVWAMSGSDYSKKSGRDMLQGRESLRRRKSIYRNCLKEFDNVVRQSSDRVLFTEYCIVVARTLKVMYSEKTKAARKRNRLQSSKMVQSTIDSLAEKISRSGSIPDKLSKNIVLFGNGSFQAQRGHASAPRKSIVRALSSRCIVSIMDEFRTSKKCPGGCYNDMVDVDGENRVRQCSIVLAGESTGSCCLSRGTEVFRCDRDESATINFCSIGYSGLVNKTWPEHLKRDF